MVKTKKTFLLDIAIYLLLFFSAFNFMGLWHYYLFLAIIFAFCKKEFTVSFDGALFALVTLSLSIVIFDRTASISVLTMIKQFVYPLSYVVGYIFISNKKTRFGFNEAENVLLRCIVLFALGTLLHIGINIYINPEVELSRNLIDIWSGEILAATGQAAFTIFPICLCSTIIFSSSKLFYKLISVAVLIYIVWANFKLACRTIMVLVVVALLIAGIYYIINKSNASKKLYALIGVAVIAGCLFVAFQNNVLGIHDAYIESDYYLRIENYKQTQLVEDPRFDYKMEYIERMVQNPFGGAKTHREIRSYAHDLFLDTYDDASVFAFLAVVAFIIISIRNLVKVLKNKNLSFIFRQLFLSVSVICYMEFMIEPILRGLPWLLALFCFMHGAVACLLKSDEHGDDEYEDCRD